MAKKVLICGATGFIGRNMMGYFGKKGFDVYGTLNCDLTNKEDVDWLLDNNYDIVIQAAATTSGAKDIVNRPYYHVTDNAVMNSLIFRSAYEHKVKHVIFFSCTVMLQSSPLPVKESDFDASQEIYPSYFGVGWTKVYCEKMCEFYSRISDTRYTVIRHSNIYGPYDKFDPERSHVFGASMTKVMTAEDGGVVRVWGDGCEERDLLYVDDLVRFVDLVVRKQKTGFELFNVGSGSIISVNDLVDRIIKHSGKTLNRVHDLSKPSIKTRVCLDINKAEKLGWTPRISLDEGIQKTMRWYRNNK